MDEDWERVRDYRLRFNLSVSPLPSMLNYLSAEDRYLDLIANVAKFLEAGDVTSQAEACINVIYSALETLVEMGVQPNNLFQIVQDANMAKLWKDGKPHYNVDGKVIKPEGWEDPHEKLEREILRQYKNQ